ncbi:MAG: EAL domain-containing response regulator [Halomonadaceae bacterium]|uniref:EAL domain-containing response regulator n=1 Tax=Halomonas colorata TaxID=2742615 RepID=A0ABR9FXV1_9GAMM|nr:EAL domain-containing response regulator [Halomonas colorata]MBE0463472.1 EAL domain-containing response regulator [Halomonas colorata]
MACNALVIDDDPEIQLLGKLLLEKQGYRAVTVGSLGELARRPSLLNVDLILLDFGLGEFTGLDILDYLHDLRLNAAILLISSCSKETATHAIEVGKGKGLRMLGFLPKSDLLIGLASFLKPLETSLKAPSVEELEAAIGDKKLFLVYQPQLDLESGSIIGVEALVRWQDSERGVLYPDSFIPLAEQSGLMVPMTWCILELALKQQAEWQAMGWKLDIAINVPAELVKAESVLQTFDQLTRKHHSALDRITLELTESAGIECLAYARHVLEALLERGCQLALDDFGTGYSSMIQLHRLPFSKLKIDRSFVSLIDQDQAAHAITLSIIDLGKRLGLTVIAEGIETQAQQRLLREAKCPLGQGYFISRPLTAEAFNAWFSHRMSELDFNELSMPACSSAS